MKRTNQEKVKRKYICCLRVVLVLSTYQRNKKVYNDRHVVLEDFSRVGMELDDFFCTVLKAFLNFYDLRVFV